MKKTSVSSIINYLINNQYYCSYGGNHFIIICLLFFIYNINSTQLTCKLISPTCTSSGFHFPNSFTSTAGGSTAPTVSQASSSIILTKRKQTTRLVCHTAHAPSHVSLKDVCPSLQVYKGYCMWYTSFLTRSSSETRRACSSN